MNVCKHSHGQFKRISESVEEDERIAKRVQMYAQDGIFYNNTCLRQYSKQLEPLQLPESARASSIKEGIKYPLRLIPVKTKTDMEWAKEFIDECNTKKKDNKGKQRHKMKGSQI